MTVEEITFVCDVCGQRVSVSKEEVLQTANDITNVLPKDWRHMEPYGDTCTRCCAELDNVYERIHAPMKARKEAYENHNPKQR